LTVVQTIREYVARPVRINSGYRSDALNRALGGSSTSQHVHGEAADLSGFDVRALFLTLVRGDLRVPAGQVIVYPERSFMHVALPSQRYPTPTFCVHRPARGLNYHVVTTEDAALRALA
jgi:zinc D-Ala-D-Ala carboxypeptidase